MGPLGVCGGGGAGYGVEWGRRGYGVVGPLGYGGVGTMPIPDPVSDILINSKNVENTFSQKCILVHFPRRIRRIWWKSSYILLPLGGWPRRIYIFRLILFFCNGLGGW